MELTHKAHAPFMPTYGNQAEKLWAESLDQEKKAPLPVTDALGCALSTLPDTGRYSRGPEHRCLWADPDLARHRLRQSHQRQGVGNL